MKQMQGLLREAVESGDDAAVKKLLQACMPQIFYFCYKMMSDDRLQAEFCTKEALRTITQRLKQTDKDTNVAEWLACVSLGVCRAPLAEKSVVMTPDMGERRFLEKGKSSNPREFVARFAPATMTVDGALLTRLPERQRACLLLYCFYDMTPEQIGRVMECSTDTVCSRLAAAWVGVRPKSGGGIPLLPLLESECLLLCSTEEMWRLLPY